MYQVVRKSALGDTYTVKERGLVHYTVKTGSFLPILNRLLGGFLILPQTFHLAEGSATLTRKPGMAKERFVYRHNEERWHFKQVVAHSYQMLVTNQHVAYELYPILSMRQIELRQGGVVLAKIEKVADDGSATYEIENLAEFDEYFLTALVLAADSMIHVPY